MDNVSDSLAKVNETQISSNTSNNVMLVKALKLLQLTFVNYINTYCLKQTQARCGICQRPSRHLLHLMHITWYSLKGYFPHSG